MELAVVANSSPTRDRGYTLQVALKQSCLRCECIVYTHSSDSSNGSVVLTSPDTVWITCRQPSAPKPEYVKI